MTPAPAGPGRPRWWPRGRRDRSACATRAALAALVFAAALVGTPARAAPPAAYSEIELGQGHETASANASANASAGAWRSRELAARHRSAGGTFVRGQLRSTERYGLRDEELALGASWPVSAALGLDVDATYSPTAKVLARHSVSAMLHATPGDGWVLDAGLRHSAYASTSTRLVILGAQRYLGAGRGAYTAYVARAPGCTCVVHKLGVDGEVGAGVRLGVAAWHGREAQDLGAPGVAAGTRVSGAALSGRHGIGQAWTLSWELASRRFDGQQRLGAHAGLQRRF